MEVSEIALSKLHGAKRQAGLRAGEFRAGMRWARVPDTYDIGNRIGFVLEAASYRLRSLALAPHSDPHQVVRNGDALRAMPY